MCSKNRRRREMARTCSGGGMVGIRVYAEHGMSTYPGVCSEGWRVQRVRVQPREKPDPL